MHSFCADLRFEENKNLDTLEQTRRTEIVGGFRLWSICNHMFIQGLMEESSSNGGGAEEAGAERLDLQQAGSRNSFIQVEK